MSDSPRAPEAPDLPLLTEDQMVKIIRDSGLVDKFDAGLSAWVVKPADLDAIVRAAVAAALAAPAGEPQWSMLEAMAKAVEDSAQVWTGFAPLDAKVAWQAMVEWQRGRPALAAPAVEPLAWFYRTTDGTIHLSLPTGVSPPLSERGWKPLYEHPAPQEPQAGAAERHEEAKRLITNLVAAARSEGSIVQPVQALLAHLRTPPAQEPQAGEAAGVEISLISDETRRYLPPDGTSENPNRDPKEGPDNDRRRGGPPQ